MKNRRIWLVVVCIFMLGLVTSCRGGSGNSRSPAEPQQAQQATVTWWFEGDFDVPIHLQIYSQARDWVWPDARTVFVFPNDDRPHYFDTICNLGEQLCYGAWPSDGRGGYWGVGQNNSEDCSGCCTICATKTVGPYNLLR